MKHIEIDGIGPVLFERSKRAKRIIITVTSYKGVRVAIPKGSSFEQAKEFLLTKTDWVKKQQSKITQAERECKKKSKEIIYRAARQQLIQRLDELSALNGFSYNRVFIRNQRTRWGSCSEKNNINLNRAAL